MNNITWEYIIDILQYTKDYRDCLQLLISCKTFYHNKLLNQLINQFYTNIKLYENNSKTWYFNNIPHRIDGPSEEYLCGTKVWYKYGKLHRTDGPALDYINIKHWYRNNKLHRTDGPAIVWEHGPNEYWINGIRYSEEEYNQQIKKLNK